MPYLTVCIKKVISSEDYMVSTHIQKSDLDIMSSRGHRKRSSLQKSGLVVTGETVTQPVNGISKEHDVRNSDTAKGSNRRHGSPDNANQTHHEEENDENQGLLFREPTDESSEYFSMIGEVGKQREENHPQIQIKLEDVEEKRKIFNVFDQDGNGVITANELRTIIGSLDQSTTEAEVMDMVNSIDSDGNGIIEFPEFLAMVNGKLPTAKRPSELGRVFKVFDVDGSGEINANNLKRMFRIFGQDFDEDIIASMLSEADFDGDGKVDLEDFGKLMEK